MRNRSRQLSVFCEEFRFSPDPTIEFGTISTNVGRWRKQKPRWTRRESIRLHRIQGHSKPGPSAASLSSSFDIQRVSQGISHCIEGKDRQKNRRRRKSDHMRIGSHCAVTVLRQRAPTGAPWAIGIVNTDADKTECRLGQNSRRDCES